MSTEKLPVLISSAPAPPSASNLMKLVLLSSAFIKTLPSASAKNPELVVVTVVALVTDPIFMLPPEFKVTTPPVNVLDPITHPPISPIVAETDPENNALLAVIFPKLLTLKLLDEINNSPPPDEADITNKLSLSELVPPDNLLVDILNPPKDPLSACILVAIRSPVKLASLAVIAPRLDTLNVLDEINISPGTLLADNTKLEADIVLVDILNPAIEPLDACILVALISPSIRAALAVIAPLFVTLNSLLEINNS